MGVGWVDEPQNVQFRNREWEDLFTVARSGKPGLDANYSQE